MVHSAEGASAPYNMALAGYVSEKNMRGGVGWSQLRREVRTSYPVLSVHLDKLRLTCWVQGVSPGDLRERVLGAHGSKVRRGRNFGAREVTVEQVWNSPPRSDGGVYFELRSGEGPMSSRLVIEFNPAKVTSSDWLAVAGAAVLCGVSLPDRLFVERYDVAFDFDAPRRVLLLDDRKRLADHFNVGAFGPQTERTGYRKGSPIKHQLYDKSAERQAKGADCRYGVTRYEVQVFKPAEFAPLPLLGDGGGAPRLVDLASLPWPGGDVTVRCVPFHPMRVADVVWGSLIASARGMGLRYAVNMAKVLGLSSEKRHRWLDCAVPEVDHSPRLLWASRFPAAVERELACLRRAWDEVGVLGAGPAATAPAAPVVDWGKDLD